MTATQRGERLAWCERDLVPYSTSQFTAVRAQVLDQKARRPRRRLLVAADPRLLQVDPTVQDHAGVEHDRASGDRADRALHQPSVGLLDGALPVAHRSRALHQIRAVSPMRATGQEAADHIARGLWIASVEQGEFPRRGVTAGGVVGAAEPYTAASSACCGTPGRAGRRWSARAEHHRGRPAWPA